jgi:hypothetical protein
VLAAGAGPGRLFDDDEARKAILDLRARITQNDEQSQGAQRRAGGRQRAAAGADRGLRRSLLDLNNQLELLRGDLAAAARQRRADLQRELADLQKRQKDLGQGDDERLRKLEPVKVTLDGREFCGRARRAQAYDDAVALMRGGDFDKAGGRAGGVPAALIRAAATPIRCATGWAMRNTRGATTRRRSPPSAPSSAPRPSTRARPRRCWPWPTARPR